MRDVQHHKRNIVLSEVNHPHDSILFEVIGLHQVGGSGQHTEMILALGQQTLQQQVIEAAGVL